MENNDVGLNYQLKVFEFVVNLKLIKTRIALKNKLNMVLMDQMSNEQMVDVIHMQQPQRIHGETMKVAYLQKHIWRMLVRIHLPMSFPEEDIVNRRSELHATNKMHHID